jgi:predicted nucleic-acid-binding protein
MKRYIIDANVLISFVTDRSPDQQLKIAPLFETAANMKVMILCHQHMLTEFVYVMDKIYNVPKDEIAKMIADLIKMPGFQVIHEINLDQVLSYWPAPISDFGDAFIATIGMTIKGATIVTFDKKLTECLKSLGLSLFSFK